MTSKIRVLHVVGAMNRAGTETWLLHVLRNIDRTRFQFDFLVHTDQRGAYDEEVEELGARLHLCESPFNPLKYGPRFLQILRANGPYDVVHSHLHHFSALPMILSAKAGVPVRIAHSHNATKYLDSNTPLPRRVWLKAGRAWINRFASEKLAASGPAAEALFGDDWQQDPRTRIVYCGMDFSAFAPARDRVAIRGEFGFTPEDFVVGHVGRFWPQKNHSLLVRVYREILRLKPEAKLLLVGEGPLLEPTRALASDLGVEDRIRFVGARPDVASLMRGAMDTFVMTSSYEGLGLAAVEAQAAGLPVTVSDQVPREADTGCGLLQFLPLNAAPSEWARKIVQQSQNCRVSQSDALRVVMQSRFNLKGSMDALEDVYTKEQTACTQ